MAQLAIRGHATRGKEVIEILEMLGGTMNKKLLGNGKFCGYYINENGNIDYRHYAYLDDAIHFTLEKFLKKFPYKIGDEVLREPYVGARQICEMRWDSDDNCIKYGIGVGEWFNVSQVQPYKEETMDRKYDIEEYLKVWKETEKGLEVVVNDRFELKENNGKFYIIKKQPQYPKTYEEICEILNIPSNGNIAYVGNWVYGGEYLEKHLDRLRKFQQLLICRDAYWKFAGEQMGLYKLWKPYNGQESCKKHVIQTVYDKVTCLDTWCQTRNILEFPTEKMRDAFYENFKELIESCKELL